MTTVLEGFERGWTLHPHRPALSDATSTEPPLTYADLERDSAALARALLAAGLQRGDTVAIWAANGPRWVVADAACQRAGLISVPLYLSSGRAELAAICTQAQVKAAVVGTTELSHRWHDDIAPHLGQPIKVGVVMQGAAPVDGPWCDYRTAVSTVSEAPLVTAAQVHPDDVLTYIFTSGTTGTPKGVVLSQGNGAHQVRAVATLFDVPEGTVNASFLPLSHALERAWSFVVVAHGMHNVFIPDPREVATVLPRIPCATFVSVPRLYEKVFAVVASAPGLRGVIARWARRVARRHRLAHDAAQPVSLWLQVQRAVAQRLVFAKVEAALGGPKQIMAVGGAPLSREVEEFFVDAHLPLFGGYGLTETSPLATCNSPGARRIGTVGRAVPGCEVRCDPSSGELYLRGENVTRGYVGDPVATAELFTPDGWLRTGDLGSIDADGFVSITGRSKELIVTAQGKNVAPTVVESDLMDQPWCVTAVVVGEARPFLVALVYPHPEHLAESCRLVGVPVADATTSSAVADHYTTLAQLALAHRARHEQVKKVRLLPADLTVEAGELTPTLKVRRTVVTRTYAPLIEDMYGNA